ncbi:transposase [Escherichia sp. E4930]|uniref:transposase n=1 Tax=unclassified Escherichia TaxID=2608889 RepID=UPI00107FCE95|nr:MULTISPECIES: transposase [unclassified Escherichia]TGB70007.1 transposase [Escherichia sp. E4930]TGC04434.1 transposase [Escherichia sp. E2661]TLU77525.1 transposase [Escherichia sp. E4930]
MDIKTRRETRQTLAQWFEEKGIEKGRQEVSQECAQRLLRKGILREDVAEVTALSLAELDKLINSN